MAFSIIAVFAQQALLRRIITHLCKEEGYLFITLHPPRLFYDEIAGAWCDLCRSRIKSTCECLTTAVNWCECFFFVPRAYFSNRSDLLQFESDALNVIGVINI